MAVKNRLKEILDERGIKQNWLAEKVGVTRGTIGNIVNNRYSPTIDLAFKIAEILDLNVNDIFYREKDI